MDRNLKKDIVPWKNTDEFIKVYDCVYSDDLSKNRWAVEQIAVWETRCWPSLPTAVEATLSLLRSKIQDNLYEASKSFYNAQEVEMMYSNAVVRFVNLLIEKDQNSKVKKGIYTLAKERNIPLWIIEIRHNSTHGYHPTLPMLRMAYEAIMVYLEDIFWLPEKSRICGLKKIVDESPTVELLIDYKTHQYQVVADTLAAAVAQEGRKVKIKIKTSARDKVMVKMDDVLKNPESGRKFLHLIMRDFVTLDDVEKMMTKDELFMDNMMKKNVFALPPPLQIFYYPLIKLLHKHNLISTFLEFLLLTQEERKYIILQKVVDHVVMYVLLLTKGSNEFPRQTTMPFICKGANLNMYRLLYSCVKGCSSSARIVFEWLVKELNLCNFVPEMTTMMNIKSGLALDTERAYDKQKSNYDMTFTVEDLDADVFEMLDTNNYRKKGSWFPAPLSTDWASIPIGHVFNPVDLTKKEEQNHEGETSSAESNENMYAYALEESKPIVTPEPENFIFKERPKRTSMLYLKRKQADIEM